MAGTLWKLNLPFGALKPHIVCGIKNLKYYGKSIKKNTLNNIYNYLCKCKRIRFDLLKDYINDLAHCQSIDTIKIKSNGLSSGEAHAIKKIESIAKERNANVALIIKSQIPLDYGDYNDNEGSYFEAALYKVLYDSTLRYLKTDPYYTDSQIQARKKIRLKENAKYITFGTIGGTVAICLFFLWITNRGN